MGKLWNTLGECKYTIQSEGEGHAEWVSCVSFSPNASHPLIVSGGWDKLVKVWQLSNCKLRTNLIGHSGYINAVTVSPDGSLCASGGKDGVAMLWDLNEGKRLYSLPCEQGDIIHALCFSPTGTGCALPPTTASASGTSRVRASWTSSSSSSPWPTPSPRLSLSRASRSPGPPT